MMKMYKIRVDCVNQKTYHIDMEGEDETEAMNNLFSGNGIPINVYKDVVQAINANHICFAEIVKDGQHE